MSFDVSALNDIEADVFDLVDRNNGRVSLSDLEKYVAPHHERQMWERFMRAGMGEFMHLEGNEILMDMAFELGSDTGGTYDDALERAGYEESPPRTNAPQRSSAANGGVARPSSGERRKASHNAQGERRSQPYSKQSGSGSRAPASERGARGHRTSSMTFDQFEEEIVRAVARAGGELEMGGFGGIDAVKNNRDLWDELKRRSFGPRLVSTGTGVRLARRGGAADGRRGSGASNKTGGGGARAEKINFEVAALIRGMLAEGQHVYLSVQRIRMRLDVALVLSFCTANGGSGPADFEAVLTDVAPSVGLLVENIGGRLRVSAVDQEDDAGMLVSYHELQELGECITEEEERRLAGSLDEPTLDPLMPLNSIFFDKSNEFVDRSIIMSGCSLVGDDSVDEFPEVGLMGRITPRPTSRSAERKAGQYGYLNTHEPFCLVAIGVQGAGKSHSLGVVLENCMLSVADKEATRPIVKLENPMTALVLHYDQNQVNLCEATGMVEPSRMIFDCYEKLQRRYAPSLDRKNMVVLVSPSFFEQRKAFYAGYCEVKPLLFHWRSLTAQQIKSIMRIHESDMQLYMSVMLDLLRRYQRQAVTPSFSTFMAEIESVCMQSQAAPLRQRKVLLESIIADSQHNRNIKHLAVDVAAMMEPGKLIVVDLTDPLISPSEANCIFQVVVEQFRSHPIGGCGKLVAMDEAHRYMDGTLSGRDGLSNAIVDCARLMRHDGLRVVISTQNPKALAPELLELTSIALIHRFHSSDWFKYLQSKIPMDSGAFAEIQDLQTGRALVFAAQHMLSSLGPMEHFMHLCVRPRLTADRGVSRLNTIV